MDAVHIFSRNSMQLLAAGTWSQTIDYTYDALYRLTAADYSGGDYFYYTYDAVGNRLAQEKVVNGLPPVETEYTYDIANRLATVGAVEYAWDGNGNLLDDGINTYTYDPANRLSSLTDGVDACSYTYSGLGDRLQQTINQQPINYTLDLNAGLTQVLDDGTNEYTYGLARIYQQSGVTPEYFLGDALGSVRQLADANAAIVLAKSYEPYGSESGSVGDIMTSYAFTGEMLDQTGLLHLRARYYSNESGRFLTRDTWDGELNQPVSYNLWLYVSGNPLNFTDPTGHKAGYGTILPDRRDLTDWLPRAAVYMATDPAIQVIRQLNSSPKKDQQRLALLKFFNLVHDGARFDVKDKVKAELGRSIKLGDQWYEYSITGNFLYGFYGSAAGYGSDALHAGAGLAQVYDLLYWLWTVGERCDFPGLGGPLEYFDTPGDALAVDFGIWSYKRYFKQTGTFTWGNLRQGLISFENAWDLPRVPDPGDYKPNTAGPYAPDYFDH